MGRRGKKPGGLVPKSRLGFELVEKHKLRCEIVTRIERGDSKSAIQKKATVVRPRLVWAWMSRAPSLNQSPHTLHT